MKAGWSESRLGELCDIEIGGTPPRAEKRYWDRAKSTNNVWLAIADLPKSLHARVSESAEHLSDEGAARVRLVKGGSLLVSFKLTLGRLAFADIDLRTNEAIAALTVRNSKQLDQRYLYWFLTYFDWQHAAEGNEKVKGKTLNKAKLKNMPVIVPPLSEQRRIVAILDEAFAGLATTTANAEKNLKNAHELFDSSLASNLVGNDESNWRGILEYFSPAVQLGLTATPKRRDNVDTYAYFGEPVYTYSLKEGINDGFLTPFKVKQIATTLDDYIYVPDDSVVEGEIEEGKRYREPQFNRTIEIEERERYRVKLFMDQIDQHEKTLVFCATQGHALLVRDLINQMKAGTDPNYCVRVTADDGALGEQFLRIFQDNEKTIPTILTTSQKLSTGVDARNVRNIVLMRPIGTMIEFKQIIGRGTRLFEGKDYFTIYDFVKAYEHFNDAEWDGEPMEPEIADPKTPAEEPDAPDTPTDNPPPKPQRIKIKLADGKDRTIQSMMATTYWSPDGRPISANQMIEALYGELPQLFKDEDELRRLWSQPDTRKALLQSLGEKGFGPEQLAEVSRVINAEKSDVFDVLAYIAFALAPITRSDRVEAHRSEIFAKYDGPLQAFLDFVLAQYVSQGVEELDQGKLSHLLELKYHTVSDAADQLGGVSIIRDTFVGFQQYLYRG